MSRRCDREGVPWPRRFAFSEDPFPSDPLADRVDSAAWWGDGIEPARTHHARVMDHLRERVALPEWCRCGDLMHPGHPRRPCCGQCPWCCFCEVPS